jgi:hypothetical protein
MALGDGRHSPVAHLRQTVVSATGAAVSNDYFLVLEVPAFRTLQSGSNGSVQAVYNLAIDESKGGPSHVVIVETSGGRQRLMLISGAERPWWGNQELNLVAHTALHAGVSVVGVAHDQIILQVAQPTGSGAGAQWAFLPFRTLAESLWGSGREEHLRFQAFWETPHPDKAPLFESLDKSVPPSRSPSKSPPLPFHDGVVRRAAGAGVGGWLTVLAEDEVLALYRSFRDLLPVHARRFHVTRARSALGSVTDNRIVIGDVTDAALQFDLGAVVKL